MTSIAMPPDPKDYPKFFEKYNAVHYPPSSEMENDYSAWGRKFRNIVSSVQKLSEEEQEKKISEWVEQNPPPVKESPEEMSGAKNHTQEELGKFILRLPSEYHG